MKFHRGFFPGTRTALRRRTALEAAATTTSFRRWRRN
jgi:hypothetical protein